jgi:hypothetical protein
MHDYVSPGVQLNCPRVLSSNRCQDLRPSRATSTETKEKKKAKRVRMFGVNTLFVVEMNRTNHGLVRNTPRRWGPCWDRTDWRSKTGQEATVSPLVANDAGVNQEVHLKTEFNHRYNLVEVEHAILI